MAPDHFVGMEMCAVFSTTAGVDFLAWPADCKFNCSLQFAESLCTQRSSCVQ